MSSPPKFTNVAVWDLTDLETGGGTTLLGVVSMPGSGATDFTGSMLFEGTVSFTGIATATFTASGVVQGTVDIPGAATATFAALSIKGETLSEDLTIDDLLSTTLEYNKLVEELFKVKHYQLISAFYNRAFTDSFTVDDTALTDFIAYVTETIAASEDLSSRGTFGIFTVDSVALDDALYVAFPISILEGLEFADTLIGIRSLISNIISRVAVGDLPENSVIFSNTTGESLTITDVMYHGWLEALTGSVDSSDTVSSSWAGLVENVSALTSSDALGDVLRGFQVQGDTVALDDLNQTKQTHTLTEIIDGVQIGSLFDDTSVTGWVMNPENYAMSQYTLGFTETATFDNQYLMADDTGLYAVGGTTDNGSEIVSVITTASLNLGSDSLKQVPQVLLGTNGTNVVLKVSIDGKYSALYELANQPSEFGTKRIKVGKGLIGNNWQFTLMTSNNSVLDLDSFEFYPIILKRNHNG